MENVHTDYEDDDAVVVFRLSNGRELTLHWASEIGTAVLFCSRLIKKTSAFQRVYPVSVGVIPTLGPVDDEEDVMQEDTVKRGLLGVRASRYFRNYWRLNPDRFDEFRKFVVETWPGMDVQQPELAGALERRLVMWCAEERTLRELHWAGFGFQVWCQTLTHAIREKGATILIVDEPEIYLHAELQRQLVGILRDLRPDILLATHSSEIIGEADPDDVVLIDKQKNSGRRVSGIEGLQAAMSSVGSLQNVALTQLSRTRRVVLTEGQDFKILRGFARVLGYERLAAGADLAVISMNGFPPSDQIKIFCRAVDELLSLPVVFFGIFDRDYRCNEEVAETVEKLGELFVRLEILQRKELENYLLVPSVIETATMKTLRENARRQGGTVPTVQPIRDILMDITDPLETDSQSNYISTAVKYLEPRVKQASSTLTREAMEQFKERWATLDGRLELVPGKRTLSPQRDASKEVQDFTDIPVDRLFVPQG